MLNRTKPSARGTTAAANYRGKQTKTGNSLGFRFESALFRSHPEFNGDVTAHVIAPGHLLVTAETARRQDRDPVMAAFLSFLGRDIAQSPEKIGKFDAALAKQIGRLTKGVKVSPEDDLGDDLL